MKIPMALLDHRVIKSCKNTEMIKEFDAQIAGNRISSFQNVQTSEYMYMGAFLMQRYM